MTPRGHPRPPRPARALNRRLRLLHRARYRPRANSMRSRPPSTGPARPALESASSQPPSSLPRTASRPLPHPHHRHRSREMPWARPRRTTISLGAAGAAAAATRGCTARAGAGTSAARAVQPRTASVAPPLAPAGQAVCASRRSGHGRSRRTARQRENQPHAAGSTGSSGGGGRVRERSQGRENSSLYAASCIRAPYPRTGRPAATL